MLSGDVEFEAGNMSRAISKYEAAAASVWNREIVLRLFRVYRETSSDRAAQILLSWLSDNPDDAVVRRTYGQYLESRGDTDSAIEQYEQLLKNSGDDPVILNNLAWQYAISGQDGAIELAEEAHRLAPENGSITDTLAWILFNEGELERALSLLERAVEQSPDDPEIQFHLATVLRSTGNATRAKSIVDELLESGVPFPSRERAKELAKSL
jgi:tetratricopeptide (TPR) repeat protein